jgi:S-adenosylmethionine hydrolase
LKSLPDAVIVDITHNVPHFDINYASFILKNVWENFPEGTIHMINVLSEENDENLHVAVYYKGHYFIGADNGIFSLLFAEPPQDIVSLDIYYTNPDATTFPERDRFVPAAVMLAQGKPLSELGTPKEGLKQITPFLPAANKTRIQGLVVYIDAYDNCITNITKTLFNKVIGSKPFEISIKKNSEKRIVNSFFEVPESELVCYFNSNGYLEIALNRAKASQLLNININDTVTVAVVEKEEDDNPLLSLDF